MLANRSVFRGQRARSFAVSVGIFHEPIRIASEHDISWRVIPTLTASGRLPRGRHVVDLAEVEARYVRDAAFSRSSTREAIWNDYLAILGALRGLLGRVEAVWLGGSFTTGKLDPNDVDSVFVIRADLVNGLDATGRRRLNALLTKLLSPYVDGYLLPWAASEVGSSAPEEQTYREQRGDWDDFGSAIGTTSILWVPPGTLRCRSVGTWR